MILVVIAMHAIPADQEKVLDRIGEFANNVELFICAEICRISIRHPDERAIQHILRKDEVNRA